MLYLQEGSASCRQCVYGCLFNYESTRACCGPLTTYGLVCFGEVARTVFSVEECRQLAGERASGELYLRLGVDPCSGYTADLELVAFVLGSG